MKVFDIDSLKRSFFKWTPRALVAGIAGYYSLGYAYQYGIMAKIDRVAIPILIKSVGTMGLGAAMPRFQWYSAWGVRMASALGAGLIYDIFDRCISAVYKKFKPKPPLDAKKA